MARNATGTYTLPVGNPVVTGTTIAITWANTTFNDVATELTDSLSRTGKGQMTAQLGVIEGVLAAPGLYFGSDTSSGFFRNGVDISATISGILVAEFNDAGIETPALNATAIGNVTPGTGVFTTISASGTITFGTLVLASGSITDTSGEISFGDDNLVTTGTLGAGITAVTTSTVATAAAVISNTAGSGYGLNVVGGSNSNNYALKVDNYVGTALAEIDGAGTLTLSAGGIIILEPSSGLWVKNTGPTLDGNRQAGVSASSTNGGGFYGKGSTYDSFLGNSSGQVGIAVTVGTQNVIVPAGTLTVSGRVTAANMTLSGNAGVPSAGEGNFGGSSTLGAWMIGEGTTYDVTLSRANGGIALGVPTGTNNVSIPSGDLIVASGNLTLASGVLIQQGSGNSDQMLQIENTSTGSSARTGVNIKSDNGSLNIYATGSAYTGIASWQDAGVISTSSASSGGLVFNSQVGGMSLQIALTDSLTIDASSNVAIPAGNLTVSAGNITASGNFISTTGGFYMENHVDLRAKDTGGTYRQVVSLNNSDVAQFGTGFASTQILGTSLVIDSATTITNGNLTLGTSGKGLYMSLGDSTSTLDFDFPEVTTAAATWRWGRSTNTSGTFRTIWYDQATAVMQLNHATGNLVLSTGDLTLSVGDINMGTGQILLNVSDGAATPPIAFSGDLDTGMYRSSTNVLGFATGGTERVLVSSSGLKVAALAGTGTRNVVVSADGTMSAP